MNKFFKILMLSIFTVFLCSGSALAVSYDFGTNITIYDCQKQKMAVFFTENGHFDIVFFYETIKMWILFSLSELAVDR